MNPAQTAKILNLQKKMRIQKEYGERAFDSGPVEIDLSDQQWQAIDLLVSGLAQVEVAAQIDCDPSTLYRWQRNDHSFIAALNQRRKDVYSGQTDRLRSLAGKAIEVLESALDSEDESTRLKAASQILKSCSLADLGRPSGPITPNQAQLQSMLDSV